MTELNQNFIIKRPLYDQELLNTLYPKFEAITPIQHFRNNFNDYKNFKFNNNKFITNIFPCLVWICNYNFRNFIINDILAGFTVAFMHIPQGMAYVALVPLPPVIGLYTSFFPVLIYAIFGTSKHISFGTYAVVSIMLGNVVNKYVNEMDNTHSPIPQDDITVKALNVALSISCLVGIIQIILGVCRIGFITTYMSTPIVRGFTTGASVHVFTSQLKSLFGLSILKTHEGVGNVVMTYIDFFKTIHTTNVPTISLSIACIAILLITKFVTSKYKSHMKFPLPIEFIMILIGTAVSYFMSLKKYNIAIVGHIPEGMPMIKIPSPSYWLPTIGQAFAIAMVAFFTSYSMAKILGEKHNYEVSSNKELIAYGVSTCISSFFSSIVPSASLSRSLVQESVGGQTQLTSLVSCVIILAVILKIGPIFESLPTAVLSAIIVVALRGMFYQLKDIPVLYKKNKIDLSIFLVTFLSTTFLDVDIGLAVGVIYALFTLVVRTQKPEILILGNLEGTELYVDLNRYPKAKQTPQTLIYSFRCFIYYANSNIFRDKLYKSYKIMTNPLNQKKFDEAKNLHLGKASDLLNNHDMKILDSSHCSFTKSPRFNSSSLSLTNNFLANKSLRFSKHFDKIKFNDGKRRRNTLSDANSYENENFKQPISPIDEKDNSEDERCILTRYNSLINEGQVGLLVESTPPLPPPKRSSIIISEELEKLQSRDETVNKDSNPTFQAIKHIVLDFSHVSFIDTVGVEALQQVIRDFHEIEIVIVIASCDENAYRCLLKSDFFLTFPKNRIFPTIHDAVIWINQ